MTVIILSVHICVHMHGRLAACISHGRRKHRRHTLFGKMAMRFPTRLTVFCCVGLAIVYSSAAIVHSHRKHPVTMGRVDKRGVSCKAMKSYGDCELLDVVLTKAGNHHRHRGSAGGRVPHTCAWCKHGAYEFCTSCSNLENLEGIGVKCRPFVRDTEHLCNRNVAAKPVFQRKQSRIVNTAQNINKH